MPAQLAPRPVSTWEIAESAANLEAMVQGSRSALKAQMVSLQARVAEGLLALPADVRRELVSATPGSGVVDAYRLGQLAFAQTLVTAALGECPDDGFIEIASSAEHLPLLRALRDEDMGLEALSLAVGEPERVVRSKLLTLRIKGITDFRSDGRQAINYLTFAGRDVVLEPRRCSGQSGTAAG